MKLAINIMVGLAVGVTILAIMYIVVYQMDFQKEVDDFQAHYDKDTNKTEFMQMNFNRFIAVMTEYYAQCGNNSGYELKIHLDAEGDLTKERIFSHLKNISWCSSIQSAEFDCGMREDISNVPNIPLPALITVNCTNNNLYIAG